MKYLKQNKHNKNNKRKRNYFEMISENNYQYIYETSGINSISKKLKIDYDFNILSEYEINQLSFKIIIY